ncbi:DUF3857 domain-containing protein [Chryseolinea sp. T2]|uniref:DUF3857 domain-containing protein n=1 Tax=Chryseolinea sp. T2 TaxID=3129255 RepID=UPI003077A560
MRLVSAVFLCVLAGQLMAQNNGFPFGKVTYNDLGLSVYPKDTSAYAVVLREFGEAYIDEGRDNNLIFEYHTVIKILKKEGLKLADVTIDLRHQDQSKEFIRTTRASSYNVENGSLRDTSLDPKSVHTVKVNNYWDQTKFAIPNVRVGSVIEISYALESPFIFNFRNWEFQSDIPKMKSEYWATIPGNYLYNISLRGYLKLTKNENVLIKDCFRPGGSASADCSRYKWVMDNVPAFIEEDYMTAKSNFISMINFELSEIVYFDGRKDRVTKEWKDADQELKSSDLFGVQLKRGKSIVDGHIDALLKNETDPLIKAQKIYSFIQGWYQWDDVLGKYSELGIKKAFDARTGNVGDINLSLVAALRYAEIEADPLLLSTRANGLPTDIHPVLSDFNYVIAKVNIGDKEYLLDATDDFLPFGTIPERCLNGKGRVFGDKASYWYDIKTAVKARKRSLVNLKLNPDGVIKGSIEQVYTGYDAIDERKEIFVSGSEENYYKKLKSDYKGIEFTGYTVDNPEDLSKPVSVKLDFELTCFDDPKTTNFLFNPFLFDRITRNPFRSDERLYPVDFASAIERTVVLTLEYPQDFQLSELPNKVGITLPNGSAKYGYEVKDDGNKLTVQSFLTIGKPVFTSTEYHYLKELYAQIVSNQQSDMLFKKKS